MRILCQFSPGGSITVRTGWKNVLEYCGHTFRWFFYQKPIFDQFDEFRPDIFICTTYDLTPGMIRCIAEYPQLKIVLIGSNWGSLDKEIKAQNFPVLTVTDKEKKLIEELKKINPVDFVTCNYHDYRLDGTMEGWHQLGLDPKQLMNAGDVFSYFNGNKRKEFESELSYIGGNWGYKGQVITKWFLPIIDKYNVKIWGNQGWRFNSKYLGVLDEKDAKDVFRSALICPNFHEPHSQVFGFEAVERIYKVALAGGYCISDYVETIEKDIFENGEVIMAKTPQEFFHFIEVATQKRDEYSRNLHIKHTQKTVLENHTYFHRCASMMEYLGQNKEKENILNKYNQWLKENLKNEK